MREPCRERHVQLGLPLMGGGEVGGQVIVQGPGIERVKGAEGAEDVLLGMAAGVEGNCFVRPQLGK